MGPRAAPSTWRHSGADFSSPGIYEEPTWVHPDRADDCGHTGRCDFHWNAAGHADGFAHTAESRIEAVDNDFEFRNHNHDDCTQFIS